MRTFDVRFFEKDMICRAVAIPEKTTLYSLVEASMNEIFKMPEWISGMGVLYDIRNVKKLSENSFNKSLKIAEYASTFQDVVGNGKRSVLVNKDAIFGTFRQFIVLRQFPDNTFSVFKELDEALQWIGIENPEKFGY